MPSRSQHVRRGVPGMGNGLGGFSPLLVPNLALWLRADLGITIGTGVSAWADQSGTGNHVVQATGANQPAFVASGLNGKPVVRFTAASSHYLKKANTNLFGAGNYTAVIVWKWSAAATRQTVLGCTDNLSGGVHLGTTDPTGLNRNAGYVGAGDVTDGAATNAAEVWSVVNAGGTSTTMRVDRASQSTSGSFTMVNPGGTAAIRLGTYNDASLFLTGDVAEVLAWSRALNAAELLSVETYCQKFWGTP